MYSSSTVGASTITPYSTRVDTVLYLFCTCSIAVQYDSSSNFGVSTVVIQQNEGMVTLLKNLALFPPVVHQPVASLSG
jgi:hypothetical protein